MAKLFQVTLPEGVSSVKLDSQLRATIPYTAKNVSARALDGRAVLISLPQTKPPSGVVENGWVKIDGNADRHFDVNKEETFTVRISVPPKSPPGKYTFRLDTVWVEKPDEGDLGGAVAFAVPAPNGKTFPFWIIPVLLVVLIGLGVGTWLLLKPHGPTVPDLKGQTITEADTALKTAGLTLDSNVQTVESKPEDSGKIIDQTPKAGQTAAKGQAIQVTVGAQMVTVPQLIGHTFQEVSGTLNEKKLTVGQIETAQNQNFAGGVVFDQSPAAQQVVKSGTAINVHVTPQMVIVQNVIGQTLGSAILSLRGLTVTSFTGDNTKTVIAQNPPPGTSVPVGSPVTLEFPFIYCGGFNCVYTGIIAQRLGMEHAAATRELQQRKTPPQ